MTENRATDTRPPIIIIEEVVVDNYDLEPLAGWLYVVIVRHINRKKNDAFPSINRLAELAKMSRASVIRYTKILEDKGLIEVKREQDESGEKQVNHYKLLPATRVVSVSNYSGDYEKLPVVSDSDINQIDINQKERESDAPTPKPETTPLPPHIALAIDNATEKQHNPLINHTGAMMMADVFIRVFEGACKAGGAPQRIPRTTSNKLIAAQWYDDGYKEDEIRRTVDLLFEAGKPVAFAFLQEKMSFYRTQQVKKVGVVEDGAIPDEWGVDSFMRQPAQKASAA